MADGKVFKGGCLCGDFRYEALGEPRYAGCCYCADCRKASGAGYIGFMGFDADAVRMRGETRDYATLSAAGTQAVRNVCARCASLVFGARRGMDQTINIYAGSLDDPDQFKPKIAIFTRGRPGWATLPEHLAAFERMPPQG